jgi:predicted nucleic acid-binding protein
MVIVDTSVWIEFFKGNTPYFEQVSELLDQNDALAISPVFGELLQGTKNAKERTTINEFWENLPKISVDELFIKAGIDSSTHHWVDKGIGLIDSVILIASRESNSFIWSLDKKLNKILHKEEKYKPV